MREKTTNYAENEVELKEYGYSVVNNLYSDKEVYELIDCIENAEKDGSSFMKTKDVMAIRQLIKNVPQLLKILITPNLKELLYSLNASDYFLTKAIYFDKPVHSN